MVAVRQSHTQIPDTECGSFEPQDWLEIVQLTEAEHDRLMPVLQWCQETAGQQPSLINSNSFIMLFFTAKKVKITFARLKSDLQIKPYFVGWALRIRIYVLRLRLERVTCSLTIHCLIAALSD